jgi:SAM-dependent methyltransferase
VQDHGVTESEKIFPATVMPDRDWWSALWPDPEETLRSIGVKRGMTALDLCCGDGWFTVPLARITDGRCYGLDLDPEMLAAAKETAARAGATVAGWIEGDAREVVTLLPERVNFVVIANTFHGVPDQPALAAAVAVALKPSGLFAIVNWHASPREETKVLDEPRGPRTELRMTPEQTRAVVEPAGFVLEKLVELPPYHYGVVFRLQG